MMPSRVAPTVRPPRLRFLREVLRGLSRRPRTLPCKYLYDERGSVLFEQICELDEYYVTRTELALMLRHAAEMAGHIGPQALLIELGSGSSIKTQVLLEHLASPSAYVPIDISRETLARSAARLSRRFPQLDVRPLCADFTRGFRLPAAGARASRRVVYFPGSTIGNFSPRGVTRLLRRLAALCGPGGGLLIGVDLQKDPAILQRAYDDSTGVTRAFNLNLLARINRELNADFDLREFDHCAVYNDARHRIEMHLVSRCRQVVSLGRLRLQLERDEPVRTECSYKYNVCRFERLAWRGGWALRRVWVDDRRFFSVQYLTVC